MKKVFTSISRLSADAEKLIINPSDSFLISYKEFLKFFSENNEIDYHTMVIGIHFTYAWMPTIFDFRSDKFVEVIRILNNVKNGHKIDASELKSLKSCFNNSLVGASKILHFINPTQYAIWDSRVYRYLYNKSPNYNSISNVTNYLSYIEMCDALTTNQAYFQIHQIIEKKVGYPISKFRSIELIMYSFGGK